MHNYHNFSTNNCGFGWGHIVPVDYGSIPNEKYRAIIVFFLSLSIYGLTEN